MTPPPKQGLPLCMNCKFVKPDLFFRIATLGFGTNQWRYAKCVHPSAIMEERVSLTTGKKPDKKNYYYADTQRTPFGECGPAGRFFEQR